MFEIEDDVVHEELLVPVLDAVKDDDALMELELDGEGDLEAEEEILCVDDSDDEPELEKEGEDDIAMMSNVV